MKTRNIIISLLLTVLGVAPLSARQFEQGEKIYVNADQSGRDGSGKFNWANDNAKLFMWIWEAGKDGQQKELINENGNIFSCAMPQGEFNRCIIIRMPGGSTGIDWNNNWGKSQNLTIPGQDALDRNFLNQYWQGDGDGGSNWLTYVPSTGKIAAYASALSSKQETIVVCPSALGGPFSLRVKLNSAKTAYDYENVQCHGWFKSTNGTTWTSVDDYAGKSRDGEGDKNILKNNLPASGSVYYYLHSAKTAGRRLIKVTTDGAKDCDLDCTITSFEVACSAVNANDTTYTLDGMVAFGVPCGDLVITCDGKSTTIEAKDAKSPQIFSIEGLRAAVQEGKTVKAYAKFANGSQTMEATVHVPNATTGVKRTHIDVLVGETTTLNPQGHNYDNDHFWFVDGKLNDEWSAKKENPTSIVFNEPNTTVYTYREMKTPPDDMKDMMENGNYETTDEAFYGTKGQKSAISDYNFWGMYAQTGTTSIDFYTNSTINPSGWSDNGFAVVKNANNFFYTFAKVQAREGSYFALFDAASDGVSGKKAWKAETAKNPNLKLQKNTTYLFSFWAANINNYGEMDNAAKLQFQIEYNGQTKKLGDVLDLGSSEFRNNRWHQCSATFTADADADNVVISVVNLNVNKLNTGNDFALDDIQFRAVSSPTHSVKIQEVITVQTHEPHIYSFTAAAQPMACDKREYDVKMVVDYDNPKGNLVIKDVTVDKEVFNEAVPTQNADWDQPKSKELTIHIDALEPAVHEYKAYFADWTKAEATASSTAPTFKMCGDIALTAEVQPMECDQKEFDVKMTVDYVNPKGNLVIEDVTTGSKVFNEAVPAGELNEQLTKDDIIIHISSLTPAEHTFKAYFVQLPATYAEATITTPEYRKCPDILAFTAAAQPIDCDETSYDVKMSVTYVNPQSNLVIEDLTDGSKVFDAEVPAGALNEQQTKSDITIHIDSLTPVNRTFKAYFAEWTSANAQATTTAPEFVQCCIKRRMYTKWDNVLFVDNHDSIYSGYQWYRDDTPISGANRQFYYTGSTPMKDDGHSYYCKMTRRDGSPDEETCPCTFGDKNCPSSTEAAVEDITVDGVAVYPTHLSAGGMVIVSVQTGGTTQATLLTLTGQVVSSYELIGERSTIQMPDATGLYLLRLQGQQLQRLVKINVN